MKPTKFYADELIRGEPQIENYENELRRARMSSSTNYYLSGTNMRLHRPARRRFALQTNRCSLVVGRPVSFPLTFSLAQLISERTRLGRRSNASFCAGFLSLQKSGSE